MSEPNKRLPLRQSTALYRQVIDCLKIRKAELGWSFWQVDEVNGAFGIPMKVQQ